MRFGVIARRVGVYPTKVLHSPPQRRSRGTASFRRGIFPSLAKEGAKREPDRAKHKEMPAPSIECSEGTFYGRGRGGWFNNRLFFDQHHPVCAINGGFAAFY